ncbi:MAG: class F sortase [Candidatus Paceibacterota bacterium]
MQSESILKRIPLLIILLSGLVLFLLLLFYSTSQNSIQNNSDLHIENSATVINSATILNSAQITSELPIRLKIPGINIDAPIEYVGLTSDGAMDVPKKSDNVAWFNLGPRPGDKGSAVIAGHYGWENNISAVFDNLHKLNKGDQIYIEDEKGMIITFVVREVKVYDRNEIEPDVFKSSDNKAHLNLITCVGVWDKVSKTYSKRLVVFTDKE